MTSLKIADRTEKERTMCQRRQNVRKERQGPISNVFEVTKNTPGHKEHFGSKRALRAERGDG